MMAWLKTHRRKIATVVIVAIPLWLLVASAGAELGTATSAPNLVVGSTMGTVQSGASAVLASGGSLWNRVWSGGTSAEEYDELEREVTRLREEKTRLIGVLQENARLRELVGFQRARPDFELAPARVIGRDITPYFRVVKIRIESDHELQPRMPVVSADGVVGQVDKVYGRVADVVLVADPRSRIDAISQRNRALGVVEGMGHEADYRARVAYVTDRDEVRVGDTMVTSGMGGVFPRELRIGTVVEVSAEGHDIFQSVTVEPAVDYSRLEELFVITGVN